MHEVRCNLCGSDDYTVCFQKGVAQLHRIVRCNRCGLMYANPQELVDCEHFQSSDPVIDEVGSRLYFQKQAVQLPDNERVLRVLNELFPRRGRLLEIGSYLGIFLDRIRAAGWDVTGLEPNKPIADRCRANYRLNIVDGVLPNPALPDRAFDAVVMLHVIEHMPDPAANLRDIRRLLRPGGVLVVETPRFDSLMFKLLGRRERSLSNCDGHIYFFTVPTLQRLLERNGFAPFRIDLVGRTLTLERFLYNVGLLTRNEQIKRALAKAGAALHLDRVRLHVNVRDMQRIYCRAI
ncbi:MAG TPA: class I SAM-dependent methyltransferase [Verrucomicrobiae bacterium]|nr:class I SAM-dependent methyltransferase [Verrucomicrobiae bacterium]